jgi:hypothetical protein
MVPDELGHVSFNEVHPFGRTWDSKAWRTTGPAQPHHD